MEDPPTATTSADTVSRRRLAVRAALTETSGLVAAEDWPNADFMDVLPLIAALHRSGALPDDRTFLIEVGGRVVGEIGWKHLPDAAGAVEVGYGVCASARGQGVARAALMDLIGVSGSGSPRVERLTASVDPDNTPSIQVLRRCGFTPTDDRGDGLLWFVRAPPTQPSG